MALKGRDDYFPHSLDEETEAQGAGKLQGRLPGVSLRCLHRPMGLTRQDRNEPPPDQLPPALSGSGRAPPAQEARRGTTAKATLPRGSLNVLAPGTY